MQNLHLFEFIAEDFRCHVHDLQGFGGPGGTRYEGVRFPVYGG